MISCSWIPRWHLIVGLLPVPACTVCFTLVKLQDDQNKRSTQGPLWNSIPRRFPTGVGVHPPGERQEFTLDRSPVQRRTHTQREEQFSFSALLAVFWDCGEVLEKTHRWNQRQNLAKKLRNVCSKRTPEHWIMHLFAGSHFLYLLYIWNAVDQRVKDAATVFARVFLWAKMGW